ncbi:MAG: hypothetical protein ACLFUS_14650, partial [Candidatus Sumerlaeia bacterium]
PAPYRKSSAIECGGRRLSVTIIAGLLDVGFGTGSPAWGEDHAGLGVKNQDQGRHDWFQVRLSSGAKFAASRPF